MLTHLSLCTGIGGIDLAAEWAGFTTVGQCEIDEYASKVLAKNFKGVPNLYDIRTVTNERLRAAGIHPERITVLSAGFPCQPYSLAGKGRGDSDSRDLWGEVKRCIGEIKPRWFVGENTPGLFARANQRYFRRILADLAEMGYSVSWGIWGACDVGANHKRARVFLCGHRNTDGKYDETQCEVYAENNATCGVCGKISDATCESTRGLSVGTTQTHSVLGKLCKNVSHSDSLRQLQPQGCEQNEWRRTCDSSWWQTEPDVGRVANVVSARVDRLRCLGNAVVPQQIYPLFEAIAQYEKEKL